MGCCKGWSHYRWHDLSHSPSGNQWPLSSPRRSSSLCPSQPPQSLQVTLWSSLESEVNALPCVCLFQSPPKPIWIPQCSRILQHNIFFHYISPVKCLGGCLSSSWWQFSETGISDPVFPGVWFPWWLSGKESACQCRRLRFGPWVRKIPWRWIWQPTPVFSSGKSHGHRSLVGYSPCGCKRVRHNLAAKTTNSQVYLTEPALTKLDPLGSLTWQFYSRTEGLQFSSLHGAGLETCAFRAPSSQFMKREKLGLQRKKCIKILLAASNQNLKSKGFIFAWVCL